MERSPQLAAPFNAATSPQAVQSKNIVPSSSSAEAGVAVPTPTRSPIFVRYVFGAVRDQGPPAARGSHDHAAPVHVHTSQAEQEPPLRPTVRELPEPETAIPGPAVIVVMSLEAVTERQSTLPFSLTRHTVSFAPQVPVTRFCRPPLPVLMLYVTIRLAALKETPRQIGRAQV